MDELTTHVTVSLAASILNIYDGIRSVSVARFHKSINDIGSWTPSNPSYLQYIENTTRRKFVAESIQKIYEHIANNIGITYTDPVDVDAVSFDTLLNYLRISWFTKEKQTVSEAISSIRACFISSITEYLLEKSSPRVRQISKQDNHVPVHVPDTKSESVESEDPSTSSSSCCDSDSSVKPEPIKNIKQKQTDDSVDIVLEEPRKASRTTLKNRMERIREQRRRPKT